MEQTGSPAKVASAAGLGPLPPGRDYIAGMNRHFAKVCGTVVAYSADDMRAYAAQEVAALRAALRQVAQAHAWLAFGECRSFGSDVPLLAPRDADALARVALGEYREGPNVGGKAAPTAATSVDGA